MARILLGDELGGDRDGPLTLAETGRALAEAGHDCLYALQDVGRRGLAIPPSGVLQAPVWPGSPALKLRLIGRSPARIGGIADQLAVAGLAEPRLVEGVVSAWERVLDLVRPDLVVAHAAPGLLQAAEGRAARVAVGGGYALPPALGDGLPRHDPLLPPAVREADLLEAVNTMRRDRRRAPLAGSAALFDAESRLVFCHPAFDFHALTRSEPLAGPLRPQASPAPGPRTGVVALLSIEAPSVEDVVFGLVAAARSGLHARVHVEGAPPAMGRFLSESGVGATLDQALADIPGARVVVHEAGAEVAQRAALAGAAQLILPGAGPEAAFLARRVTELGVGRALALQRHPSAEVEAAVRDAAGDEDLSAWCAHRAGELRTGPARPGAAAVVAAAARLTARAA